MTSTKRFLSLLSVLLVVAAVSLAALHTFEHYQNEKLEFQVQIQKNEEEGLTMEIVMYLNFYPLHSPSGLIERALNEVSKTALIQTYEKAGWSVDRDGGVNGEAFFLKKK